jgi:IclR family acetate operon transcriptional repressor|tara:strand:+ start:12969 stop:13712 length:744 start_codon:yes stop_codon:yes gene_type:complete
MSLLEILAEHETGCRLTDLAMLAKLSLSTTHRLLTTLEKRRFVEFNRQETLWHIGRQSFAVGSTFVRERNFVTAAMPYLRQLRDTSRETANLGVIVDGEVVFLTQVESREIMRAITRVGGRAPMVCSGMGKAILAAYSGSDVMAITKRYGLRQVTPNSITRHADLVTDLEAARAAGYAVDNEEFVAGLRCIASVVYNHLAEPICAISISGLSSRISLDRIPPLGEQVRGAANGMTAAIGGTIPSKVA